MPVRRTKPIILLPESIASNQVGSPLYYGATRVSSDEKWAISISAGSNAAFSEVAALRFTITNLVTGESRLADPTPARAGSSSMGSSLVAFGASKFMAPAPGYPQTGGMAHLLDAETGAWSDGPVLPDGLQRLEAVASYGLAYLYYGPNGERGITVVDTETLSVNTSFNVGQAPIAVAAPDRKAFLVVTPISPPLYFNLVHVDGNREYISSLPSMGGWLSMYGRDKFVTTDYLTSRVYTVDDLELVDEFTTDPTLPGGGNRFLTLSPELLSTGVMLATEDDYNADDPFEGNTYLMRDWYYSLDLGRTWVYDEAFSQAWAENKITKPQISLAKESFGLGGWATPQDSASMSFGFRRGQAEVCYWTLTTPEPEPEPEPPLELPAGFAQMGPGRLGVVRRGKGSLR